MSQATNPPTLNLKLKFAENDVSFGSESTSASESECENVKIEMSPNLIQLLKERCCILDHIIKVMELQELFTFQIISLKFFCFRSLLVFEIFFKT